VEKYGTARHGKDDDIIWCMHIACWITKATDTWAVPWLRWLATGLPPRRPWFDPRSVHVGFVVDKVALGQVFPEYFSFRLSISFHRCSIARKRIKKATDTHS
jgi:hypothetical protein